jgi:phosphoglycolate phosphatase-like HAD superfamily hydrolase
MPSAIYTLERLKSAGSKLCAATNKIAPLARKVLEQHGLIEYFDEVYGSDLHRPKPSAEMIFSAMKEYPASVNLMFGDRPEDVIAANSAGVSSIFFSGEFDELLSKTGACPDFTVSGWHEILEIQEVWAVI